MRSTHAASASTASAAADVGRDVARSAMQSVCHGSTVESHRSTAIAAAPMTADATTIRANDASIRASFEAAQVAAQQHEQQAWH